MNSLYDKLINQRTGLETKNAMFLENKKTFILDDIMTKSDTLAF